MRISRRTKKEKPTKDYLYNEFIAAPRVLVLGNEGGMLGEMNTSDAIARARAEDLDLVLINPKSDPPVARFINFGQFRYQQEKEARLAKAHQHVVEIKGVRLSLRIGAHDLDIRKNQTLKFLDGGDKVKIELMLRGREMQQGALGFELVKKFIDSVNSETPIRVEQPTERHANKMSAIIVKA